jgi:hypothetical protein
MSLDVISLLVLLASAWLSSSPYTNHLHLSPLGSISVVFWVVFWWVEERG